MRGRRGGCRCIGLRREDEREVGNALGQGEFGSNPSSANPAHARTLTRPVLSRHCLLLRTCEEGQAPDDAASWKRATSGRTSSGL